MDRNREIPHELIKSILASPLAGFMRPPNGNALGPGWSDLARAVGEIARAHAGAALLAWWQVAMARALPEEISKDIARADRILGIAYLKRPRSSDLRLERANGTLSGRVRNVLFGDIATDLALLVPLTNGPGVAGVEPGTLVSVPVNQPEVSSTPIHSKGLKACGLRDFELMGARCEKIDVGGSGRLAHLSLEDYVTLVRGLGLVVDIHNGVGALDWIVANSRRKLSLGKPLLKWQAVQFKISDGDVKLRMLQDMAAYLAWVLDQGRERTEWGLGPQHYGLLLSAMYRLNGAQIQEDCLELGCGRVYREDHRNWRRYMDYLTMRLLFEAEEAENEILGDVLLAGGSPVPAE
jgi:alkylation response protein AidB-like acyl-CoA dehydrogenase